MADLKLYALPVLRQSKQKTASTAINHQRLSNNLDSAPSNYRLSTNQKSPSALNKKGLNNDIKDISSAARSLNNSGRLESAGRNMSLVINDIPRQANYEMTNNITTLDDYIKVQPLIPTRLGNAKSTNSTVSIPPESPNVTTNKAKSKIRTNFKLEDIL